MTISRRGFQRGPLVIRAQRCSFRGRSPSRSLSLRSLHTYATAGGGLRDFSRASMITRFSLAEDRPRRVRARRQVSPRYRVDRARWRLSRYHCPTRRAYFRLSYRRAWRKSSTPGATILADYLPVMLMPIALRRCSASHGFTLLGCLRDDTIMPVSFSPMSRCSYIIFIIDAFEFCILMISAFSAGFFARLVFHILRFCTMP